MQRNTRLFRKSLTVSFSRLSKNLTLSFTNLTNEQQGSLNIELVLIYCSYKLWGVKHVFVSTQDA